MPAVADKSMVFKIGARDEASAVFGRVALAAGALEKKLDDLDRKHAKPKVTLDTGLAQTRVTALTTALGEISNKRARVDVDLGTATADVGDLRRELSYLRDVKVKVRVDLGTSEADMAALGAQMASFRDAAATLRVRVDAGTAEADMAALGAQIASFRDVTINVDLRTDQALTRVAALRTRLEELRNVQIGVVVNSGDARAELTAIARAARRLNGINGADIRIKIEVDAGGSVATLTAIATLLREIRGTTRARVQVDTGNSVSAVAKLASGLGSLFKVAGGGLAIPGLIATVGQLASLGGAAVSLLGVLGLVPAAGLAAGAAIGAVAIGLGGLADALGPTGTAAELEKVNAALAGMAPAGRELVTEIRALGPAWSAVRLEVQQRLLAGLGTEVRQLGATYLPTLRSGLGGVATELNSGVRMWSDWAGSGPAVIDLNTILGNTRATLRELAPAGTNVAAALTDISVVGSTIMPELAAGATAATGRFREFIAEARRTGELEQWIRGGISTLEQLGRIAGNTGGILGSVFSASEEAGYGFLDAVEQITGELDQLLSTTAGRTALVEVFRESRDAVNATLPGMRELGAATLETTGAFARSDGLERFGTLVSQTASAITPLVAQVGTLGGQALGDLAGGASLAVSALTPLASGAAAVVEGLGPVPGLVLASVVAFKGLGLATATVVALGTRIAATAALTGTLTAGLTGSVAAGALAQGAMTRFGGAVQAAGRALPIVGVALVLAAAGFDALTTSADEAAVAMAGGGRAAAQAVQDLAVYGGAADYLRESWGGLGGAMADAIDLFTTNLDEYKQGLDDVGLAQVEAAAAGARYYAELERSGPASAATAAAQREYAAATDAVEAAQREAEQATQSYSERLRDQASAAQSALGANLQLEDALARVAAAHDTANAAAAEHGAGSEEATAAARDFVAAADQTAQSAARVAEGLGGAEAGTAAYGATLLNLAASAEGPARDAMLNHLSLLSQAELDSLSAGAAALGFATQIITLPDGKTVTIAIDPETGKVVDTQTLLDGMRDGNVAVNLETQQALTDLDTLIGVVNGAAGSVNIDGNPMAAGVALQTVLGQIATGAATVTINGQAVPASTALSMILNQIQTSGATVTINGQNVPAAAVLRDTLGAIAAGQETVTINGQSIPARGALGALLRDVGLASAIMSILGRDGGVQALKNSLSTPSSSTHTIYVKQMGALSIRDTSSTYTGGGGRAMGAYAIPRALGAYATAYAYGGMRPMSAARAEIVPPRQLRIIGDRMRGDEAFIPIDRTPRSLSILDLAARRMGFDLMPRGTTSPVATSLAASAPIAARPSLAAATFDSRRLGGDIRRPTQQFGAVVAQLARGNSELRAQLAQLGEVIRARSGVTVNQTFPPGNPAQNATASAIGLRVATR